MKRFLLLIFAFVLLSSHDMYLKLDSYFLSPNSSATIQLFNGTFHKSDNVITRDRMVDVSLVGNAQRTQVDSNQWAEKDNITLLDFETGAAGTWIAGVSTRARNIEMSAEDFNGYLEHDGVIDMLAQRQQNNTLDQAAVERYSKHVKTIFQVGEQTSTDWQTVLGYPIEFVPLENPYDLHPGHALRVELLLEGKPLANQLVYVNKVATATATHTHADGSTHSHAEEGGQEHSHGEGTDHSHTGGAMQFRTDTDGILSIPIDAKGIWHLRTIHLVTSDEPGLTHESNWATLTFEVGEGHSHLHTTEHVHEEGKAAGIPGYVFLVGSLLLIAGLFFWFNRKQ
ncbi:MAG TPA: DUF4198 domain-containing protein [Saprospiraceae bacterium]|nr:DUF4198 domain-containing protein [Saprospiraceae bacterium]